MVEDRLIRWMPTFVTGIFIPLAVWLVTSYSDRERVRQEYVRIAVAVLQPTANLQQPQKELRKWAVDLIQDSAPIKLSPEAMQTLIEGTSSFHYGSSYGNGGLGGSGGNGPDENNGHVVSR